MTTTLRFFLDLNLIFYALSLCDIILTIFFLALNIIKNNIYFIFIQAQQK